MFDTFFKKLLPVAAIGLGLTVSGCDGMNIRIGDKDGVPLADLDMSGDAPKGVVLAGPDTLVVTEGAKLDIKVEGDQAAVDALRFNLEEGTLGIMREKNSWKDGGTAYSSPVLLGSEDGDAVVVETADSVVGLDVVTGALLWKTPFVVRGRGYNAATPIVAGDALILTGSGRGTRLATIEKGEGGLAVEEAWPTRSSRCSTTPRSSSKACSTGSPTPTTSSASTS